MATEPANPEAGAAAAPPGAAPPAAARAAPPAAAAAAAAAAPPPRAPSITLEPLSIAYYCTGHGLGHATRAIEVCKHLVERGHSVTVVTGAPARVFLQQVPAARFTLRKAVLDCGSKQIDPFTVDMRGSLEEYLSTAVLHREELLEREVSWLRTTQMDLVVSDVVPIACAAAARAGVPAVCVTNFSWDFIYSEYLTTARRPEFRRLVWQIALDYSQAALLLRLPGHVPMPAFQAVEDVPLVVRKAQRSPSDARQDLGLPPSVKIAVLIYGGHRAVLRLREDFLPQGWVCVICNGGQPLGRDPLPPNFILAPADAYTPDIVAAGDCVIGKIGYGTMSECLAHGKPLVFVRRDFFNEEPFLRKKLELHGAAVEMKRRDFFEGHWGPYLARAAALPVNYTESTNGAEVVARRLEEVGRGAAAPAAPADGAAAMGRMRDAVVFGYLMASAKESRVEVPEWYVRGTDPNRRLGSSRNLLEGIGAPARQLMATWDVLTGCVDQLQQLPDTLEFLQLLSDLDAPPSLTGTPGLSDGGTGSPGGGLMAVGSPTVRTGVTAAAGGGVSGVAIGNDNVPYSNIGNSVLGGGGGGSSGGGGEVAELPERRAARGLFRWDDDVFVARAPGRLDVMGGIADYSGSLVLQMPVSEACHVALQRHPLEKQGVWRHMKARHDKLGGPRPALRVVSYHADPTNRAPTFDMDMADLYEADTVTGARVPVSYETLRAYFKTDPAVAWASYVAGCLLVLARERGVVFDDGVSMLIASDVPEGKGVSSSAALEVAVMSALAAAYRLSLDGRELALLCHKVENLVVGAPCGVMDQMASSLGGAGQLLALLCQPAEVLGHVEIPHQIRFWGIDSGIRHSVGGADYASVRVGAFMGRTIMRAAAGVTGDDDDSPAGVTGGVRSNSATPRGGSAATSPEPGTSSAADHISRGSGGGGGGGAASLRSPTSVAAAGGVSSGSAAPLRPVPEFARRLLLGDAPAVLGDGQEEASSAAGGGAGEEGDSGASNAGGSGGSGSGGCYLASVPPSLFREVFEGRLPEALWGDEFLGRWGHHGDAVTRVDPEMRYAVRIPTSHPIHEYARVCQFRALLESKDQINDAAASSKATLARSAGGAARITAGGAAAAAAATAANGATSSVDEPVPAAAASEAATAAVLAAAAAPFPAGAAAAPAAVTLRPPAAPSPAASAPSNSVAALVSSPSAAAAAAAAPGPLEVLGELMLQSHASYSACGLGSDGTNRLVDLVREHAAAARAAGRPAALFGAKITGGGSGGTVCVMGLSGAAGEAAIAEVVDRYSAETGHLPAVFAGSSPGASRLGALRLRLRAGVGRSLSPQKAPPATAPVVPGQRLPAPAFAGAGVA